MPCLFFLERVVHNQKKRRMGTAKATGKLALKKTGAR